MGTRTSAPVRFDMVAFAADVEAYRERQGITTTELARVVGVHRWTLREMIALNRAYCTLGVVAAVAYAADLSLDRYIGPDE